MKHTKEDRKGKDRRGMPYVLDWESKGDLQVVCLPGRDTVVRLSANPGDIKTARFSRDMRGILCLNRDGTVGVWRIPRTGAYLGVRHIVEYLERFYADYETFRLRRGRRRRPPEAPPSPPMRPTLRCRTRPLGYS